MTNFKENLAKLKEIGDVEKLILKDEQGQMYEIPNAEGKRGSLQVYLNVLDFQDGIIGPREADKALALFAEHTRTAYEDKNQHPNIQRLIPIAHGYGHLEATISYD